MELKIGDIVELKSGSVLMTVLRIVGESTDMAVKMIDEILTTKGYTNGDVVCQWYCNGKFEEKVFKPEVLQIH